jgi:hypothetical protein
VRSCVGYRSLASRSRSVPRSQSLKRLPA